MKPEMVVVEAGPADAKAPAVRLMFVQGDARPPVDASEEPMVMTFPHLLARELVAFLTLSLILVALALFLDAPLEEVANADKTPNPAKAPWYFLGLQELLHYYPPVVSGVILPGLLIVALAVVPYFKVNLERPPLWTSTRARVRLTVLWSVIGALSIVFATTGAHPVWPLIGPLWFVGVLMTVGGVAREQPRPLARWLATRSIPFWVFAWFLLASVVLTIIGVFFRGPGWAFTLPWREGIF